jgi:AcrR family transcriptional regulator
VFIDYSEHVFIPKSQGEVTRRAAECRVRRATRGANPRGEGSNLRDELVVAATELLLSPQPVSAPSLRSVARAAGVAPSAVYLHFSCQADLVDAVVVAQFEQVCALMEAADDPAADPESRLAAITRAYVGWGLDNPGAYQLVFERPAATDDAILVMCAGPRAHGRPADDASTDRTMAHAAEDRVPGFFVLHGRLVAMCQDAGMTASQAQDHLVRWWAMAHGLTSLRLHKPAGLWQHDMDADVRAVAALMAPAAAVRLQEGHSAARR